MNVIYNWFILYLEALFFLLSGIPYLTFVISSIALRLENPYPELTYLFIPFYNVFLGI